MVRANGATSAPAWGNAPGNELVPNGEALKARLTYGM